MEPHAAPRASALPRFELPATAPPHQPARPLPHPLQAAPIFQIITHPLRWPNKPGRNAPCPCGSGVKYKRCCGRGTAPLRGYTSADRDSALSKLVRFLEGPGWPEVVEEAEGLFWDYVEDGPMPMGEQAQALALMSQVVFEGWLFYDFELDAGWHIRSSPLRRQPGPPPRGHWRRMDRATLAGAGRCGDRREELSPRAVRVDGDMASGTGPCVISGTCFGLPKWASSGGFDRQTVSLNDSPRPSATVLFVLRVRKHHGLNANFYGAEMLRDFFATIDRRSKL